VVEEGECGFKTERAAVEVQEDWDLLGDVGVEFGEIQARRDGGVFGDYYVFGCNRCLEVLEGGWDLRRA